MKKIALIGNCQLQQIGHYFQKIDPNEIMVTWHLPPFLMDSSVPLVDLYSAIESADIVFTQYHDTEWGDLSTESIGKYFDLSIVPTLESPCSSIQINYLSKKNKYNIYDIDFRILDLYLKGYDLQKACKEYHKVNINHETVLTAVNTQISKYQQNYSKGLVIADYSDFYKESISKFGPSIFHTHNHPANSQLEWLANVITIATNSCIYPIFHDAQEILTDTLAPILGSGEDEYTLKSKKIGLNLAIKIFYTVFNSFEKTYLISELEKSSYSKYLQE